VSFNSGEFGSNPRLKFRILDGGWYDVPLSSTPRQRRQSSWHGTQPPVRTSASAAARPMMRAFIAAGLVDHLHVVEVPILLGRGVRLWDGLEGLEQQYDVEVASTLTFTR
jgi:hypothetical protein